MLQLSRNLHIYIYIFINNTVAAGDHLKHRRRLFGKNKLKDWKPFGVLPHRKLDNMGRTITLVNTRKWRERTCKLCPLPELSFWVRSLRQTVENPNLIFSLVSLTSIRLICNLERVSWIFPSIGMEAWPQWAHIQVSFVMSSLGSWCWRRNNRKFVLFSKRFAFFRQNDKS